MHAVEIDRDYTTRYCQFVIDDIECIDLLPTTQKPGSGDLIGSASCCAGSLAWCVDGTAYTLNGDDEWVEYTGFSTEGGSGGSEITVKSLSVTENGLYRAPSGNAYSPVRVSIPEMEVNALNATQNGTYTAPAGTAYGPVNVNVPMPVEEGLYVDKNGTYVAPAGKIYSPIVVDVPEKSGPDHVEPGDVTFYDYDGSAVATYTASEFSSLNKMPENPTHSGRISQGWNWSLSDAKAYVANHKTLSIGQMYIASDGKTHITIRIPKSATGNRLDFTVRFAQTVEYGVTVDWGDGSNTESYPGTNAASHVHTYSLPGIYDIALDVTDGTMSLAGTSNQTIYGSTSGAHGYSGRVRIEDVQIGYGVTSIGAYAFMYCHALRSVTIPHGVTNIGEYAFHYCYSMKGVVIPDSATSLGGNAFCYCYGMESACLPRGLVNVGNSAFQNCYTIESVSIPDSVTSVGSTSISGCYALMRIDIPSSVTNIGGSAFSGCYCLSELHMHSSVPPVLGSGALSGVPADCRIYVPAGSLSTYRSATNWSVYATYMIESA